MQQRPDLERLLGAVADFLAGDLANAIADDRALRFRVLIAGNLIRQVAAELAAEDDLIEGELAAAAELLGQLPQEPGAGRSSRRRAVAAADAELARRLRTGELPAAELDRVRARLLDNLDAYLAVTDPRFERAHQGRGKGE